MPLVEETIQTSSSDHVIQKKSTASTRTISPSYTASSSASPSLSPSVSASAAVSPSTSPSVSSRMPILSSGEFQELDTNPSVEPRLIERVTRNYFYKRCCK